MNEQPKLSINHLYDVMYGGHLVGRTQILSDGIWRAYVHDPEPVSPSSTLHALVHIGNFHSREAATRAVCQHIGSQVASFALMGRQTTIVQKIPLTQLRKWDCLSNSCADKSAAI